MRTLKTLTLPSGWTCEIRPISAGDMFRDRGDIPQLLAMEVKASRKQQRLTPGELSGVEKEFEEDPKRMEQGFVMVRICLLHCVRHLRDPEGNKFKLVAKPFAECGPDEIALEEASQEDSFFLVQRITEISGITKGAASPASSPFPEAPTPSASD